jgi:hypothetical protein
LAGCSPSSASIPAKNSQIINNGSSFGQTFTDRKDGLSGVSVLLGSSLYPSNGSLFFSLRTSPQSDENIATARLPISEVDHQGYYNFDFPPISDSRGKDYFFNVKVEGAGVEIYNSEADSYFDGALYIDQSPQEAQLGFRLNYDYKYYILGLLTLIVQWIGILLIGTFAFVLPGWAILSLLWPGWEKVNWYSKLGLSGGLSLAIYPLLILWSNLIGLHLGSVYAFLPAIACLFVLIWKNRKSLRNIPSNLRQKNSIFNRHNLPSIESILADIAALIIIGLIIASRFWVIRSLDVPLFGDSYQHTMISQLIIDHGGLFNSWAPYADLVTFTYHFGFHSSVAVFHWISGLSVEKSVLWTGQLINILAIIGLYPLAYKITTNKWAGVIAMLIGGLLSPMPMYYVNWGRYTQLAGQAILPAVIWCAWSILDRPLADWQNISWFHKLLNWKYLSIDIGRLVVVWLVLGGIALTHYRILILIIFFFPAYILITFSRNKFIGIISRIAWIGIGGLILAIPWFIHIYSGELSRLFTNQISTLPPKASANAEFINITGDIQFYLPKLILILFLLSVAWSLWKRKKDIMIFTFWWILILIATNPSWIGLPGNGVITNFTIFIALYIPASIVIGSVSAWILIPKRQLADFDNQVHERNYSKFIMPSLILLIIIGFGFWGTSKRIKVVNLTAYELVTRPDLRAFEWIRDNTAVDDNFLVNSFFAYNNTLVAGSDGGWWIPMLAARKTTLPPLTYGFEEGDNVSYFNDTNNFYREIQNKGITEPEVISMLKKLGIRYIYIGQRQGEVNNPGPKLLDSVKLVNNPNFKVKYNQDNVWIFEIDP